MEARPLRPPIDIYVRHSVFENELIDENLRGSPLKRKVGVEMESLRKRRRHVEDTSICGGERR